jgi:hypothetical protein
MLPNRDLRLFTRAPYNPFAPVSRQGEASNTDFSVTATWELHNDFSGGVGHLYEKQVEIGDYENALGVNDAVDSTVGQTLFTGKRKVILPPVAATAAGAIATFKQFIEFSGAWYAVTNATPGVIYKYDATGVTPSVVETLTAACTQLYTDGATLYASQGASNVARSTTDGTTWADCAYNANVHCVRDESILTYAYGSILVPGTGYPDTVPVGWTNTTINSCVYMNGMLFFGKPEGLYSFSLGRVSCIFPVYDQYDINNFKHLVVHHSSLYFTLGGGANQNSLWYWFNAPYTTPVNLFPDDTSGFDAVSGLFASFGPLLVAGKIKDSTGTSRSYLFFFDGPEHPGLNPVWSDASGAKPIVGCGSTNVYDTTKVRVYLSQTTAGERWLDFQPIYEPANFKTESSAKQYMTTVEFSAGFRTVKKWDYELVVNVRNPNSTTYAQVWYQLDSGTWTQSQDKDGNAHTLALSSISVGTYLPLNSTATYIKLRVYMWTTTSTAPAEISHLTIRGLTMPKTRYQFSFPVDCSERVFALQGGEAESGEAICAAIFTAAEQGYPCKLCDWKGNWHLVAFRAPSPQEAIQSFAHPDGNAPTRAFTVVQMVLMEINVLDSTGTQTAWTPG